MFWSIFFFNIKQYNIKQTELRSDGPVYEKSIWQNHCMIQCTKYIWILVI